MRTSNPILSRRETYSPLDGGYASYPTAYATAATGYPSHTAAARTRAARAWAQGTTAHTTDAAITYQPAPAEDHLRDLYVRRESGRMTLDDVIAKTATCVAVVVMAGAAAWAAFPATSFVPAAACFVAALVLGLYISVKQLANPAPILVYAALQGLALGAVSHAVARQYSGVVVQAVLGTVAVFVVMLAAYRVRLVRVTTRFSRVLMVVTLGFLLLTAVNLMCARLGVGVGDGLGFRTGGLGIAVGVVGVLLGAMFLALDFQQVEESIRYGAPARQSWLAAFGMTLSLVWIYLELLRLFQLLTDE